MIAQAEGLCSGCGRPPGYVRGHCAGLNTRGCRMVQLMPPPRTPRQVTQGPPPDQQLLVCDRCSKPCFARVGDRCTRPSCRGRFTTTERNRP